jgi:transposase
VELADLAQKRLRGKIPELRLALEGKVTDNHRFLLRMLLDHVKHLEELIERVTSRIEELMLPFAPAAQRLQTIPGVGQKVAEVLLAEIGPDMSVFPTAEHLSSWAGMSPGNNESAGKRHSGKTTHGSRWLRAMLVQAAWAASHTKGSYLADQFRRLASRRGKKRALIAVGHTILVIAYHVLKKGVDYKELGADYLARLDPERVTRNLVKRLQKLGHKVTLEPMNTAA